jgi:hypothetical protein
MMKFTDLEFKQHPCVPGPDAVQAIHFFPNGYGVSVVRFPGSYGYSDELYEVAVIKGIDEEDFQLCYDTPITDDVMGHRDEQDVENIMEEVAAL